MCAVCKPEDWSGHFGGHKLSIKYTIKHSGE
jgi:hypothetical protein